MHYTSISMFTKEVLMLIYLIEFYFTHAMTKKTKEYWYLGKQKICAIHMWTWLWNKENTMIFTVCLKKHEMYFVLPKWLQFFICEHWKLTVVVNLVTQRQETNCEWVWMLVTQADKWRKTLLTPQQRSHYVWNEKKKKRKSRKKITLNVSVRQWSFHFKCVVVKMKSVHTDDWNLVCIIVLPVGLFFFSFFFFFPFFHVRMLRKFVWSQWRVALYEKTNALWWTFLNAC